MEKLVEAIPMWHSGCGSTQSSGCLKFSCQYVAIPLTTLYTNHHLGFVKVGAYSHFEAHWCTQKGCIECSQLPPVLPEAADPHLGLQGPFILMEKATIKACSQKLNLDKLKREIISILLVTVINC